MTTTDTATSPVSDEAIRCSAWARDVGLSPVGTAGSQDGFVLVDLPLPWPRDVGEIPALAALAHTVRSRRHRFQAMVPDAAEHEVVLYTKPEGSEWFCGYERRSAALPGAADETLGPTMDRLLSEPPEPSGPGVDLLVCTHGRRDVCCGSLGTELSMQLLLQELPDGVALRRTSHTGGHRFAPTFLLLPQGTLWAFADVALVDQVLTRSVPFAAVAGQYRGCAGLSAPAVQALERSVLADVGWDLLDRPRRGTSRPEAEGSDHRVVRLELADGSAAWEGVVAPGRTLPVPDCMRPISEAYKSETEWVVQEVAEV